MVLSDFRRPIFGPRLIAIRRSLLFLLFFLTPILFPLKFSPFFSLPTPLHEASLYVSSPFALCGLSGSIVASAWEFSVKHVLFDVLFRCYKTFLIYFSGKFFGVCFFSFSAPVPPPADETDGSISFFFPVMALVSPESFEFTLAWSPLFYPPPV